MTSDSDQVLLQAISRQDDRRAFAHLYQRYYPTLRAQGLRILGEPELAEEVASDILLKLWQRREELTLRHSLRSYLCTAIRHRCIDHLRKRLRHLRAMPAPGPYTPERVSPSPEEETIYRETVMRLEQAVASLPPQGQHVFRLSRDEGLQYREIAVKLNVSVKTVETHMRRALMALRQEMAPYLR